MEDIDKNIFTLGRYLRIQDIMLILRFLKMIWESGGWGSVVIVFKNYEVDIVKLGEISGRPEEMIS